MGQGTREVVQVAAEGHSVCCRQTLEGTGTDVLAVLDAAKLAFGEAREGGLLQALFRAQLSDCLSVALVVSELLLEGELAAGRVDGGANGLQVEMHIGGGPIQITAVFIDLEMAEFRFRDRAQSGDFLQLQLAGQGLLPAPAPVRDGSSAWFQGLAMPLARCSGWSYDPLHNPMKLYVGVTDGDWFNLLRQRAESGIVEEVNFWSPSSKPLRALQPGEMLLFKLHAPDNFIVGGGFFTRFLRLPIQLAWEAFGLGNGVNSVGRLLERVGSYRHAPATAADEIGCTLLGEPFFLHRSDWIAVPDSFSLNIVRGKTYDTEEGEGRALWDALQERMPRAIAPSQGPAMFTFRETPRFGTPVVTRPRLGQGGFRVLVTEAYERRCSMTGERTLPALEAAHIRPYSDGGEHDLRNGLLLRSDLHRLFDQGYLSIDPADRRILVSRRIREEFENGKDYYRLNGLLLRPPVMNEAVPGGEYLAYHAENVFR